MFLDTLLMSILSRTWQNLVLGLLYVLAHFLHPPLPFRQPFTKMVIYWSSTIKKIKKQKTLSNGLPTLSNGLPNLSDGLPSPSKGSQLTPPFSDMFLDTLLMSRLNGNMAKLGSGSFLRACTLSVSTLVVSPTIYQNGDLLVFDH
jgi:X-X-X-Leu-X-X-Gly heptad repeat protein